MRGVTDHAFEFDAPVWRWQGDGANWYFVSVPLEIADDIADLAPRGPGFGSVRVQVRIGSSAWGTSLFPSTQEATYVLPVKKAVRDREHLDDGDVVHVGLTVSV